MPLTHTQKFYTCELCNYSTHYRHLIKKHINRKNKCGINNENISISHTLKQDKTHTEQNELFIKKVMKQLADDDEDEDQEEAEQDSKSVDTNYYMCDIIRQISLLNHQDLAILIKSYINDNLDEDERTDFLEYLINEN